MFFKFLDKKQFMNDVLSGYKEFLKTNMWTMLVEQFK